MSTRIAALMKQATENCVRCGKSKKATDGKEYHCSCENCSHLRCESLKPKETNSSRIVYESVWTHLLCGPCHNKLGSQGHGLQEPFSSGKGICNPAFAATHGCETLPCHLKTKESGNAGNFQNAPMLPSPHIHCVTPNCAPCNLGKIQKADPRDSGWIVHPE